MRAETSGTRTVPELEGTRLCRRAATSARADSSLLPRWAASSDQLLLLRSAERRVLSLIVLAYSKPCSNSLDLDNSNYCACFLGPLGVGLKARRRACRSRGGSFRAPAFGRYNRLNIRPPLVH